MTKKELIIKTEDFIKSIPYMKEEIKNIDSEIKICNEESKEVLSRKKFLNNKIQKLRNAMNVISEEDQKIIFYKYFENMTNCNIGRVMGYSPYFFNKKKLNNILFEVGRVTFVADIVKEGLEE